MTSFPGFGRIFDFTAKTCERHLPQALPILRQSRLFCFPHDPVAVLPKKHEHHQFWMENFALPYPITAIEDPEGLVVLWDSDIVQEANWWETVRKAFSVVPGNKGERHAAISSLAPILACDEPMRGLNVNRFFLDIVPSWGMGLEHGSPARAKTGPCFVPVPISADEARRAEPANDGTGDMLIDVQDPRRSSSDFVSVTVGVVRFVESNELGLVGEVGSMGCWYLSKRRTIFASRGVVDDEIIIRGQKAALQNVRTAIEEIMWFNDPNRVVVEEKRDQPPRPRNLKGKVKRATERPTYHSWTPLDIRRLREGDAPVVDSDGDAIKKRGHWRRGHFRTLRADRYARSGMQGKTILVRPAFIGDATFSVERSHYRILLGEDEVLVGQQQDTATIDDDDEPLF